MFQVYGRKVRKPFTPDDLDCIRNTIYSSTSINWRDIERRVINMGYPKNNVHFIFNNVNRFNDYRDIVYKLINRHSLPDTPQLANFILYKMCEINYDRRLKYVPFTGLTNKTKKYDVIWLYICKDQRYQFIVSDFVRSFNFTCENNYM